MTIAIDPGKSGGVTYRDTDRSVHAVPMPDTVADLDRLLRVLVCPQTVCFIEDLPMYRGKMNLRSTAVLCRNFGRIEGVLASLKCRVEVTLKTADALLILEAGRKTVQMQNLLDQAQAPQLLALYAEARWSYQRLLADTATDARLKKLATEKLGKLPE
jgi:hypothetical protein